MSQNAKKRFRELGVCQNMFFARVMNLEKVLGPKGSVVPWGRAKRAKILKKSRPNRGAKKIRHFFFRFFFGVNFPTTFRTNFARVSHDPQLTQTHPKMASKHRPHGVQTQKQKCQFPWKRLEFSLARNFSYKCPIDLKVAKIDVTRRVLLRNDR